MKKKDSNIILSLTFIIPFIIIIICMYIGHFAPFGEKNIFSATDQGDFITYYYEMYDTIKEHGSFFYSNTLVPNHDFSSMLTYNLSAPSNYLILLFNRSAIISVINILYALKLSLSCAFMYIYLRNKKNTIDKYNIENTEYEYIPKPSKDESKKDFVIGFKETNSKVLNIILNIDWCAIALSISFAFTNYMIAIASNISYLSSIMLFPLVMLGVDKLIYEKKYKYFIIFFTLSIFCNIHISIISLIFIIFYSASRKYKDFSELVNSMLYLILSGILCCLLSGIVIINSINGPFFSEDLSLKFPEFSIGNPFDYFCHFLPRTSLSFYSLYGKNTDICIGAFLIFFTFAYLFNKRIHLSCRLSNIIILVFYISGTFLSISKYILNGFSVQAGLKVHFGYILSFMIIIIAYEEILLIKHSSTKNILIAGLCSIILLISCMLISSMYESMKILLVTIELIFAYFIISLIYSNKSMKKDIYLIIISIILLFDVIPSFTINLVQSGKGYLSQSINRSTLYSFYECSRYIHKSSPEASIYYYTSSNKSLIPTEYSFAGYDYIITKSELNENPALLEYVDSFYLGDNPNPINIYKNNSNTAGCIFDKSIERYKYDKNNPFLSTNILSSVYFKQGYIFSDAAFDMSIMETSDPTVKKFVVTTEDSGDMYFMAYVTVHLGNAEAQDSFDIDQVSPQLSYYDDNKTASLTCINNTNYSDLINSITANKNDQKYSLVTNKKCVVDSDKEGYYSTGLTNSKSLSYYVNNKKVVPVSFIGGNTLIPVNAGSNNICIKYNPIYLIAGILVSIISFIILITYNIQRNRNEKNNK